MKIENAARMSEQRIIANLQKQVFIYLLTRSCWLDHCMDCCLGGPEEERTTPTAEEISLAAEKISSLHQQDKMKGILEGLYRRFVDGAPPLQLPETLSASRPKLILAFADEIQQILHFQKKIAAQTFIRRGYGVLIFQQEISKHGGLFDMTEHRYRQTTTAVVLESFALIADFLRMSCGEGDVGPCQKVEGVCLQGILLNCRRYFGKEEIVAFLKFVALLFEDECQEVAVGRTSLLAFYNRAKELAQFKQTKGRSVFRQTYAGTAVQSPNPLSDGNRSHLHEARLLQIFAQVLTYGATKERYQTLYGSHPEYSSVRSIQGVIFRVGRKALRDLEECHRRHFCLLPPLADLSDAKIKRILTYSDASALRGELVAFSLLMKRRGEHEVSYEVGDLDLVKLSSLIRNITAYLECGGCESRSQIILE